MNTVTSAIDESRLINRLAWRLMPLLGILYLVAYIDRSNISFAKLQMLGSLGLSEVAYGLGASLFFIGYLIFEIPSNVMLHKYGAPKWMARIMFTWGVVTILLAFTNNATMFYVLRFLLGASEAGLYPGVIYYLTLWFPQRHRVRMLGYFTVGSSLGNMVGAPICGSTGSAQAPMMIPVVCMLIFAIVTCFVLRRSGRGLERVNAAPVAE
ncbi:MFS transporter [Paraburkholderia sp. LEh10]|uniref:MFS transporter n=1 Tax=Paraburkholderia sp. LEh10 TaxID=2821353 RepID=UPI0028B1B062|nr:MFS transporter [Paraburkholderia sp. LEh10]